MDAEHEVRVLAHGDITPASLPQIRTDTTELAQGAGLDVDRAEKFALAVHEVATNTVDHADGTGEFAVVQDDSLSLYARVADHGPGLTVPPVFERPPVDAERGRGLWLSRELTDQMRVDSDPAGTVVELEMFLGEDPEAPPPPADKQL
jgi:anti-sigma regulatory factor (Ser/Thr protein kinase)